MFAVRARDLLELTVPWLAGASEVQVDSRFGDGRAIPAVVATSLRIGGPRAEGSSRCPHPACRVWAVHPTDRVYSCGRAAVELSSWDWRRTCIRLAWRGRGTDSRCREEIVECPDRDFPQGTFVGILGAASALRR